MQNKRSSHKLLMEMQFGTTILETSFSPKRLNIQPRNPTPRYYPREIKT